MIEELLAKVKKIIKGSFFKNVTVIMTGTAIAQALSFLAYPVLSRLYEPSAFGVYGLFTAVSWIISVVATGKYELAILLPKKREDAANLLWVSIGITFLITILSFIFVLFFKDVIAKVLDSPKLAGLLFLAPISIFFTGIYNAFNYWTTRNKEFKRLSYSKVIQSLGREGSQLLFGFFSNAVQSIGLVFGYIIGQAGSSISLVYQAYKNDYQFVRANFDKKKMIVLAKKHIDFPKFNAPQNFLNSVSQNVPAILLAYYFNPAVVGFYWFTFRVLVAPNQLIGNSIRQVFYQRANELVNSYDNVLDLFKKTTGSLALMGILPFFVILFFGPDLFELFFGENWLEAGYYARWLILWWFFLFINPPSIMLIPILNLQKYQFYIEICTLIFRVVAIVIGGLIGSSITSIALFSIVGMLINIFVIIFIYKNLLEYDRSVKKYN